MQKVCLIIPCFNEASRLKKKEIHDFLLSNNIVSFCFVNDGSVDGTLDVLTELRKEFPERIEVQSLKNNSGKAEAVRQGVLNISSQNKFEFIGFWDADLSTPLEEAFRMLEIFKTSTTCVLAMGSRMKRLGSVIERRSSRHILGRMFSTFSSWILRLPVYDSQCGSKIFRGEIAIGVFNEPFISKWLFDVEIIARLRNKMGMQEVLRSIVEVPLNGWKEVGGSKLRLKHFIRVPFDLLRINSYYNRKK